MRLRTKLNLWMILLMIVTVTSVSLGVFLVQKEQITSSIRESEKAQGRNWAAVCREALSTRNDLSLLNYIQVLKTTPGLLFAYLVRPNGEFVVHTDPHWIYGALSEWAKRRPDSPYHDVKEDVVLGGKPAATAVIGFSNAYREESIREAIEKTLHQILRISLGVLVLGIILASLLSLALTRPLKALVKGAEEIGKGHFDAVVAIGGRDELGNLAAEFNRMAKQLAQLDELKDEFIQSVSHDLKGPLAAIRMYSEHMLSQDRGTLNPRQKEMMNVITESSGRLGIFINTILDTAKIKAGKMAYYPKPSSLISVIQPVIDLLQVTAQRNKLTLVLQIPPDIPQVQIDTQRCEMAVSNLLTNAIKFTPEGGQITVGASDTGRDFVEIFVQDTGYGMAPEKLPCLFQRFGQIDISSQKEKKISGTGLGLFLVKQTIEAHGGRVRAESAVGKGTIIYLTLPKAKA